MEDDKPDSAFSRVDYKTKERAGGLDTPGTMSGQVTPQLPSDDSNKAQQLWTRNITDSGFGSAHHGTFSNSSRSTSVSAGSSARSSPQPIKKLPGGRRVTLANCEFSPVTRESFSIIRSRKLSFDSIESLPGSSGQAESLEKVGETLNPLIRLTASQENCAKRSVGSLISRTRKVASLEDCSGINVDSPSMSPVSPGLFSFDKNAISRRLSRLSSEEVSLESSLQDMSLEESSSSSSSVSSSRRHSVSISPDPFALNICEENFNKTETEVSKQNKFLPNRASDTPVYHSSNLLPLQHNLKGSDCTSGVKTDFMSALHLTFAQSKLFDITTYKPSFTSSLSSLTESQSSSSGVSSLPSSSSFRSPDTPSSSLSLASAQKEKDQPWTQDQLYMSSTLEDMVLLKSPCKRYGSDAEDPDLLSPTKARRTSYPPKSSPAKNAVRKIFATAEVSSSQTRCTSNTPSTSNVKVAAPDSQTVLNHLFRSPSDCHCNFLNSSPSVHGCSCKCVTAPMSLTTPCLPHRFMDVVKHFSPSDPSRLIGRNMGVVKFDIVAGLSQHFSLCVAKIFSFLCVKDFKSVSLVSLTWKTVFYNDTVSIRRYKDYIADMSRKHAALFVNEQENADKIDECDTSLFTPMIKSKGGCLSSLQAQAKTKVGVSETPKVDEIRSTPSLCYGDQLRHCPRCQHPALIKQNQGRAACTDPACGFDFCTQCFSAFHRSRPCKPLSRALSKSDVAGSSRSKKTLRRL